MRATLALATVVALTAGPTSACRHEPAAPTRAVREPTRVATRSASQTAAPAREGASTGPLAPAVAAEEALGAADRGIFSDLDHRVQLTLPATLDRQEAFAAVDHARGQLVLYAGKRPIKVYPLGGKATLAVGDLTLPLRPGDRAELSPLLRRESVFVYHERVELPPGDADDDGIPDPLDLLIGARKTALNAANYDGRFERIDYPGGDVPREVGVCTDVIIRALRNAGRDLQQEVHLDIKRRPRAYPMVDKPNPHIDHRRVKTVLPYFQRHWEAHSPEPRDPNDPLLPGDVVFFDTFPSRPGTEHVGIVSDQHDDNGLPLVINNWTEGTVTKPMELLSWVTVTHRFRLPGNRAKAAPIHPLRTQLITAVADDWNTHRAVLRRYARDPGQAWQPIGKPVPAVIGRAGYGWGRGLHGPAAPAGRPGPTKQEGDLRSPAGVFALGKAYGYGERPNTLQLPYVRAQGDLRCVDDPASPQYNRIVSLSDTPKSWRSAEHMRREDDLYELAIVVAHNTRDRRRGGGSCIFLHVWAGPDVPVTGCTAMSKQALWSLAAWLQPNGAALVSLPRSEYAALADAWSLPPL